MRSENESAFIGKADLYKVQDHKKTGSGQGHLRQPETQTEAGISFKGADGRKEALNNIEEK